MKYLITGGLGVIDSNVAQLILQKNHKVTIIDPGKESRHYWVKNKLQDLYPNVDIRLEELEHSALDDLNEYDAIFHFGARTGIPSSKDYPVDDFNSNVLATHYLLEKLRLCNKKIPTIITSSVKPYAVDKLKYETINQRNMWIENLGINEDFPFSFDENYAATKIAQSAMAQAYAKSYELPIVVFRCSNLYGPAMCKGAKHGWLTHFCLSAVLDKTIEIQGTGTQVRDMLWFSDVYSAAMLAIENIDKCAGEIFNLGGGILNTVSVLEAVEIIEIVLKKKIKTTITSGRKFEDPIFITDCAKYRAITGWKPKVTVEQGIINIINWASDNKSEIAGIYNQ